MAYVNIGEETEKVEFKKSTGEMKEGVVSIASILNKHESGDLYFGVKNNGDVIGQEISDSTIRDVSQAIRTNIKPPIYPEIEKLHFGARVVIHVRFEGKRRPYLAYGIPRIRVADEDVQMDQELYREMLNARENRTDSWETKISKYHISDVDDEVYKRYLEKARESGRITFSSSEPRDVMTKLELAEGDALLNAGAALFVNSGMNELQMAVFASDERLTFLDIKRYTGSIFLLVEKAVQYIVETIHWRVEFIGRVQRKEIPEIPIDAVREAIVNAFGHRDLESMQAVEIAIYKSYIDIYSPGKFAANVSPERFISQPLKPIRRNPLITRTMYYSKDMESFATGLKRIHDLCLESGVRVDFLTDEFGFTVRFYRHCGEVWTQTDSRDKRRRNHSSLGKKNDTLDAENGALGKKNDTLDTENGALREKNGALKDENGALEEKDGVSDSATSQGDVKVKLKELILRNPRVTRKEMAEALGIGVRTVQRYLNEMEDVRFTGGGKNGRWEIL